MPGEKCPMPEIMMAPKSMVDEIVTDLGGETLGSWRTSGDYVGHTLVALRDGRYALIGTDDQYAEDNWPSMSEWFQEIVGADEWVCPDFVTYFGTGRRSCDLLVTFLERDDN
jgi:hypothetical protein